MKASTGLLPLPRFSHSILIAPGFSLLLFLLKSPLPSHLLFFCLINLFFPNGESIEPYQTRNSQTPLLAQTIFSSFP